MALEIMALIVVYGEPALQTDSFRALVAAKGADSAVRVLIWNNSPHPQSPIDIDPAWVKRLSYISTPDNLGLSMIYNRVIADYLRASKFLLILDQDSLLPADFFVQASEAVRTHPDVDLSLPMVWANQRWVSPLTYFNGWGRYWPGPRVGMQKANTCTAINSGKFVAARYLKGDFSGYDERLSFYGADTQFMVVYASQRTVFYMLDAVVTHDLSFFSSSSGVRCRTFLTMKSAYRWICEKHPIYRRVAVAAMMGAVSLFYALRYRSLGFLARS